MVDNNYPAMGDYYHIDAYNVPENQHEWSDCPKCKLKPVTWVFDNGEHTACGCWNSKYDHFDIQAPQTILENVRRTGGFDGYDRDAHRQAWNKYCEEYNTTKPESKKGVGDDKRN